MLTNKGWRQKGFSLTELMVAVAIIGILTAIVLPMYGRYVDNTRLNQAKSVVLQLQQEVKILRLKNGDLTDDDIATVNAKGASLSTENGLDNFFEFEAVVNDTGKVFVNANPSDSNKSGLYVDSAGDVYKCAAANVAEQTSCDKF